MLELRQPHVIDGNDPQNLSLGYGGDTLNTAVYLARLGQPVDYVTALGDDHLSDWMIKQWGCEGVGCDHVARVSGTVPGMYMVQTDSAGERSFLYWRYSSPARRLFDDDQAALHFSEALSAYEYLYFSGITLAIFGENARSRFIECVAGFQQGGGTVVFDGNYRKGLWPSAADARSAFESVYALTAIAMPTLEDECDLFGDGEPATVIQRLHCAGAGEVVLKMGEQGCMVSAEGTTRQVAAQNVEVVDTTAAGDSFNAAYLAARITGSSCAAAASAGHSLASVVIQYPGAIIPRKKMPG